MRLLKNIRTSIASAVAVVLCCCLLTTGCTSAQKQNTLQIVTAINNHIPEVVSAADTVAATIAALVPADAALINVGDVTFDTAAHTLQALTAAYLASPNASTLTQIQNAINALESQVNTATLNVAHITNPQSQQLAIAALKGLLTVITVVFGLIMPTESTAMLDQLRATETIHLARLRPYMDAGELERAARAQGVNLNLAFREATALGF